MFQVVLAKERASVYVSGAGSLTRLGDTMERTQEVRLERLIGMLALQVAELQRELQAVQRGVAMDYDNLLDRIREADQQVAQ